MKPHYQVSGRGDRALVLCNGLGTTISLWDLQLEQLEPTFRVVRWDIRGHGQSPPGAPISSVADLAGDVLELLDDLGIERASFAGVSLGGNVGMWLGVHARARVERLVLACTSATFGAPQTWLERATLVRASGTGSIADASIERWFTAQTRIQRAGSVELVRERLIAVNDEAYAGCCEALAAWDIIGDLPLITASTLVIAGGEDSRTPPAEVQLVADAIGDSQFATIDAAAHLANIDRPAEFTRLMLEHLGR